MDFSYDGASTNCYISLSTPHFPQPHTQPCPQGSEGRHGTICIWLAGTHSNHLVLLEYHMHSNLQATCNTTCCSSYLASAGTPVIHYYHVTPQGLVLPQQPPNCPFKSQTTCRQPRVKLTACLQLTLQYLCQSQTQLRFDYQFTAK